MRPRIAASTFAHPIGATSAQEILTAYDKVEIRVCAGGKIFFNKRKLPTHKFFVQSKYGSGSFFRKRKLILFFDFNRYFINFLQNNSAIIYVRGAIFCRDNFLSARTAKVRTEFRFRPSPLTDHLNDFDAQAPAVAAYNRPK